MSSSTTRFSRWYDRYRVAFHFMDGDEWTTASGSPASSTPSSGGFQLGRDASAGRGAASHRLRQRVSGFAGHEPALPPWVAKTSFAGRFLRSHEAQADVEPEPRAVFQIADDDSLDLEEKLSSVRGTHEALRCEALREVRSEAPRPPRPRGLRLLRDGRVRGGPREVIDNGYPRTRSVGSPTTSSSHPALAEDQADRLGFDP